MSSSRPEHPSEFDRAIAVTPAGPSSYDAHLSDGWRVGNAINGGVLMSLLGNALRQSLEPFGHPDPFTVSAYYLSTSVAGRATVETETVRKGRTLSTAQASLLQYDDRGEAVERIRALATYGDLESVSGADHSTIAPPDIPPPGECVSRADMPSGFVSAGPLLERFDMRYDPATTGWALGNPSGDPVARGWFRLPDGREPDPLLLLMAVDALPPVTFSLGHYGWVPTLELTVHVRAHPAPGWLLLQHVSRNYTGGMLEEDAEVWDSTGRLVAQSRQLARAPRRRRKDN